MLFSAFSVSPRGRRMVEQKTRNKVSSSIMPLEAQQRERKKPSEGKKVVQANNRDAKAFHFVSNSDSRAFIANSKTI
jgi:hypothetical protein